MSINSDQSYIDQLTQGLTKNPIGTSQEAIAQIEAHFNCKLPQQYLDFMLRSDGAYGKLGKNTLRLYKVEDLVWFTGFWVEPHPFIIFATNNGTEAYAFDRRRPHLPIANIPLIGTIEDARPHGETFIEFLERRPADPN